MLNSTYNLVNDICRLKVKSSSLWCSGVSRGVQWIPLPSYPLPAHVPVRQFWLLLVTWFQPVQWSGITLGLGLRAPVPDFLDFALPLDVHPPQPCTEDAGGSQWRRKRWNIYYVALWLWVKQKEQLFLAVGVGMHNWHFSGSRLHMHRNNRKRNKEFEDQVPQNSKDQRSVKINHLFQGYWTSSPMIYKTW